jgi:hypothetical protein
MQVNYNQALQAFSCLDKTKQIPSLHPYYVRADSKRDKTLEPVFFLFEENKNIFYYAFHLSRIPDTDYFDIQSPYGYGGPIASCNDSGFSEKAWAHFSLWCLEHNVIAEFVRFHPLLRNWQYFRGDVFDDRQTVWIDLTLDDLFMSYLTRSRTVIRKATKSGLSVEWLKGEMPLKEFYELYSLAMKEKEAGDFYVFPFEYHEELLNWDCSHLAICKLEGKTIAASLFLIGPSLVEYHLSYALSEGRKLGASSLLLHEAAIYSKQKSCVNMHLGGGTDKQPDNPLLFFKKGFSRNTESFKIGKKIHNPEVYARLKKEWQRVHGVEPVRVLFYRS